MSPFAATNTNGTALSKSAVVGPVNLRSWTSPAPQYRPCSVASPVASWKTGTPGATGM
jgi:hypothetical protein